MTYCKKSCAKHSLESLFLLPILVIIDKRGMKDKPISYTYCFITTQYKSTLQQQTNCDFG